MDRPLLLLAPEIAHQMGLVPTVMLACVRAGGRDVDPRWWAIAGAFLASWVADWISHWTGTFPLAPFYLTAQGLCLVWALAPREAAWLYTATVAAASEFVIFVLDRNRPDLLVHTVAWLGVLAVCWRLPLVPGLRVTLALMCGVAWVAWMHYVARPGWGSWLTYQSVRGSSVLAFCWASRAPAPLA